MDDGAKGWLFRTARKNFWRVADWYDIDDLIQDGYMCYYRVLDRYQDVHDKPHVMRLFQVTYINHIHDLSKKKTKQLDVPLSATLHLHAHLNSHDRDYSHEYDKVCADAGMIEVPPSCPVSGILGKLLAALNSEDEIIKLQSPFRVRLDGTRETLNDRLCALIGIDPDNAHLASMLRSYLETAA